MRKNELIKTTPSVLALPNVPNGESVNLDSELNLLNAVLERIINSNAAQSRAARDLLELIDKFNRAILKFESVVTRYELKSICNLYVDEIETEIDLTPLREILYQKVDGLQNVQN